MEELLIAEEKNEDENLESKLTETILKLEEIDKNLFRANYLWKSETRGVYGGQIIGQALVAAGKTVPEDLHVHSMHCYFLLSGDGRRPIIYHVENMRDGKSFSTRLVKAIQNGKVIFTCMVSYHKHEFSPLMHQYKMPDVPPPDGLLTLEELLLESLSKGELTDFQQAFAQKILSNEFTYQLKPIPDSRFKANLGFLLPKEPVEPKVVFWIKMKGKIDVVSRRQFIRRDFSITGPSIWNGLPLEIRLLLRDKSQHNLHRCVAAYISDTYLLSTALLTIPRKKYFLTMMTSLDHSLWFHSNFSADEWMLYECENPRMTSASTTGMPQKYDPPADYLSPTTDQEAAFLILNHLAKGVIRP